MSSTQLIRKLREASGARMVDCKQAIMATEDLTEAFEWLRRKGLSRAAKMAERVAQEGLVAFRINEEGSLGCIVEVNSETDFVARNGLFQEFAASVAKAALQSTDLTSPDPVSGAMVLQDTSILESIPIQTKDGERSAAEAAVALSSVVGERIAIRRMALVQGTAVAGYAHNTLVPAMGLSAAIVALTSPSASDDLIAAAKRIAMHAVAAQPRFLNPDCVPLDLLDRERAIIQEQFENSGKPENIVKKIVSSKLDNFTSEFSLSSQVSLVDQDADSKVPIAASLQKTFGSDTHLSAFALFKAGE